MNVQMQGETTILSSSTSIQSHPRTLSRKRTQRSSPISSPLKLTRSPVPKMQRRLRTGTEKKPTESTSTEPTWQTTCYSYQRPTLWGRTIDDFQISEDECLAIEDLKDEINTYMLHKVAVGNSEPQKNFLNIQDYFSVTRVTHTEKSNVIYLQVKDAIADTKDTMMDMLHELHQQYVVEQNHRWLIVEGDAKIYEILQSLKFEYGEELLWVIPYPGDWHMLKNYQIALMKPYFDAGLKSLAQAAGYPVAAIQSCGQFKRTHNFLLEAWEATYRAMLAMFLESNDSTPTGELSSCQLQQQIIDSLNLLPQMNFTKAFNDRLTELNTMTATSFQNFKSFLERLANVDKIWKFWVQFVFVDAMAYVGLFLAIRSGDWELRVASMKLMAPVFTSFNHQIYQKLIAQHVADILCMPPSILGMFQQGGFVISICGRAWHSVGIDEAHEMLINKGCKTSIVRPHPDYINRIAHYVPYRTKVLDNLKLKMFPEAKQEEPTISSPFSSNPTDRKCEMNIQAQISAVNNHSLFPVDGSTRELVNPFTNKEATLQQTNDLLNFRATGEKEFSQRITSFILKEPSRQAPNRKRHLQTFSAGQRNTRKISQLERDKRLILSAMKKKMLFSKRTGRPIDKPGEQLIELPLAISDNDGKPLKGQKSYSTKTLESRYKATSPPVFTTELPWRPQCSIVEGMFLINTTPLGSHRTLADYARFLMRRYIIAEFNRGSEEVHLIFDNPGRLQNTPKYFEHVRRDATSKVSANHCCDDLEATTDIPRGKWRENFLNCRVCKRNLVKFIGKYLLHHIGANLQPQQSLYVAGAFDGTTVDSAWFVRGRNNAQPDPTFTCNGEETDTRLWLHAKQTKHTKDPYNVP